ncbi:MAG: DNA alkylation repair protein [Clostridia bacterium]|nr:DNA alkylation repair protein [Clostridia bacterium]
MDAERREELLRTVRTRFEENSNSENALQMKRYMKDRFLFYGIQSVKRRELYSDVIKEMKAQKVIDFDLLDMFYEDEHREMNYFVMDAIRSMSKFLSIRDMKRVECFISEKQWWDIIDSLAVSIGNIKEKTELFGLMDDYSRMDDIWFRRVSILFQLQYGEDTETELLSCIIDRNLGTGEFFIDKAIGWALRQYARTDALWVRDFVEKRKDRLSRLSIREALRHAGDI